MRSRSLVVILVLAGLFVAGLGLGQATGAIDLGLPFGGHRTEVAPEQQPSRPVRLAIPTIGVRAVVNPVGLARDGTIDTPPLTRAGDTGWFSKGPAPGQYGPAIIVGHLDTATGPAVFAQLPSLEPGQLIEVTRRDKRVVRFVVDSVETFDKADLPAERIYHDFSKPALRLITCGGRWVGGETGYADNVVVFATLAEKLDAGKPDAGS